MKKGRISIANQAAAQVLSSKNRPSLHPPSTLPPPFLHPPSTLLRRVKQEEKQEGRRQHGAMRSRAASSKGTLYRDIWEGPAGRRHVRHPVETRCRLMRSRASSRGRPSRASAWPPHCAQYQHLPSSVWSSWHPVQACCWRSSLEPVEEVSAVAVAALAPPYCDLSPMSARPWMRFAIDAQDSHHAGARIRMTDAR